MNFEHFLTENVLAFTSNVGPIFDNMKMAIDLVSDWNSQFQITV